MTWSCQCCGETDEGQRAGRLYCSACKTARSLYATTQNNLKSGFNRKNKGSPEMGVSADEFCRWRKAQDLRCHYCGIRQEDIPVVRMKSQIQRDVRVLGVDRIDSSLGYAVGNLVPCCFVCNQIKGDRFSAQEMLAIGQAVGAVWRARIASAAAA